MNRRDILKSAGAAGIASLIPFRKTNAAVEKSVTPKSASGGCVLIPSETAGPFPLDLTANSFYFRQDIREDRTGVQFNLKLKIIGDDNCLPMQNLRINIWHCSKDGLYSGYDNQMNQGQAGLTYLRGYQMTDANGEVEFITIFPGWYNGRVCHIHFQVYVSSMYSAVSQLTFPVAEKNAVYAAHSSLYTNGADPTSPGSDNVFSNGYNYQLSTLTPNVTTGGYDGYLEVTINGSGITGLAKLEPETGGQFKLAQNFPNPYSEETTISFTLKTVSDVKLELFSLDGKKAASINNKNMNAGEQNITLNLAALGLANANYVYQLEVSNSNGVFRQCKMMTAVR